MHSNVQNQTFTSQKMIVMTKLQHPRKNNYITGLIYCLEIGISMGEINLIVGKNQITKRQIPR